MLKIISKTRFNLVILLLLALVISITGLVVSPKAIEAHSPIYWVGDSGNWSDTAHWSTSSGGGGGHTAPAAGESVVFDQNSCADGAFTVTINVTANCNDFDTSLLDDTMTLAGSSALNVYGSYTIGARVSRSWSGTLTFKSTSAGKTITFGGGTYGFVTFDGVGGGWTFQDGLTMGSGNPLNIKNGAVDTNGQAVSCGMLACDAGGTNDLHLGASTFTVTQGSTLYGWDTTNLDAFDCGTSTINVPDTMKFIGGGFTYYNVVLTGQHQTFSGTNTYTNLTFIGTSKLQGVWINNNHTVTGTFTATGTSSTNRLMVKSNSAGTQRTITAAAVVSSHTDYQDIIGAGAGDWDLSSSDSIDYGNNVGLTFTWPYDANRDYYWTGLDDGVRGAGKWQDEYNWSTTSGGGGGGAPRLPVPGSTNNVYIDSNSGFTVGNTLLDLYMGAVPTFKNIDFTGSGAIAIPQVKGTANGAVQDIYCYGSMTLIAGMSDVFGHTGSCTQRLTLKGSGTITTNGAVFGFYSLVLDATGTYTLGDNLTANAAAGDFYTFTYTAGTLDCNGKTITITGGSSTPLFAGGSRTYYNVTLLGDGIWTISGANTFNNLTRTGTNAFTDGIKFGADQVVSGILTLTGYDTSHRLQFGSSVAGTQRQITVNGSCAVTNTDVMDSAKVGTASPDISAGNNSDLGDNLGWIFTTGQYNYWVGNSGNWSDITHWATSSGGAGGGPGSRVPLIQDMAVFDANSFQITGKTVTIDITNLSGIDSSAVTNYPTLTKAGQVDIYGAVNMGHMVFSPTTTFFKGKTSVVVLQGTDPIVSNVTIQKDASIMGSVTMGSNFTITGSLTLSSGNFNLVSYTLTVANFDSSTTTYDRSINLGSGIMLLNSTAAVNKWNINPTNLSLSCGTSTIAITNSGANAQSITPGAGLTYYNFTITGGGTYTLTFGSTGIWNTWFIDRSTSAKNIAGNYAQTFQTLAIPPNGVVTIGIANVDFVKAAGTVVCDYLNFTGGNNTSTASGGATFYAGSHSGGSPQTGWNFTDPVAPTITTQAATNVSSVAATLNGNLTNLGGYGTVYVYFHYDNLGTFVSYSSTSPKETKTGTGAYYYGLTGLSDAYNYYFRAVASDGYVDLAYGATQHFIASGVLPTPGENPYVHGGFVPNVGEPGVVYHTPGAISGFVENPVEVTTLPAYALFKRAADELGWTTNVLYAIFGLFIVICLGVGAGILTGSALLAVAAMLLTAAALISTTVLGWWVLIVLGILLIGYLAVAKSF